jgi:hypothetical protein
MSYKLVDRVLNLWKFVRLSADEEQVLTRLAQHAHDDGTHCYPSIPTLAKETGKSERAVQRHLQRLQDLELIRPVHDRRGGHAPGG